MTDTNDGGPAFPEPIAVTLTDLQWTGRQVGADPGMSLLDYFAAAAMHGMLSRNDTEYQWQPLAFEAYEVAYAMLAERAKGKEGEENT